MHAPHRNIISYILTLFELRIAVSFTDPVTVRPFSWPQIHGLHMVFI